MRLEDEQYFERIEDRLDRALSVAREARTVGGDPTADVEIPVAKDMADRVENILGIEGVAERVREMEADPDISREEAALELAHAFAKGEVGDYETRAGRIEGAVRTAVALLTEGVVAAPIEGIDRVELLQNDDGTEFVNVYYAGPIRSAGGTAQALSVLVADYARTLIGIDEFKARTEEVERYAEELDLYDSETGLQYAPKDKETKYIARHLPVMLDGEPTGDEEVSGFRDLERVDTNSARGGMCLVLGEGIAQKAPKIQRYTRQLEEVDWPWLQDLIDGTIGEDEDEDPEVEPEVADETLEANEVEDTTGDLDGPPRADPARKFLRDLIAGRPVFSHPSETGGFRLRYGRARNHGFATAGVHPATMHLVDDFLATGTQIKTERPGKAAGVVPVDTIEGPTVRLANGDVRRIDDPEEALAVRNGVEKILDLGEYLVNYGEFVENNHPLAPAAYTVEWWVQDLAAAGANVQALRDSRQVNLADPSFEEAFEWATEYDAPLHPSYTYLWHDITVEQFEMLAEAVANGEVVTGDGDPASDASETAPDRRSDSAVPVGPGDDAAASNGALIVDAEVSDVLEALLVEHTQDDDRLVVRDWRALALSLGLTTNLERQWDDLPTEAREWPNAMKTVEVVAPFSVQERAPTRVGNRMGRPEKSEKRELSPAVHTLFPIGEAGGDQRNVADAASHVDEHGEVPGQVHVQIGRRECPSCAEETFKARCPSCNAVTDPVYECYSCDRRVEPDEAGRAECPRCEKVADAVQSREIDLRAEYQAALDRVGERENVFEILKGVKGLSSADKIPEPLEKGVLRAKNGVSAFKDGTVRYDMTDLPVTAVRPTELDVTADQFRGLGYETDVHGEPLRHDDQLVELKVQDVVLSDGAAEHMLRTADFVDDLLTQYYGLDPFYDVDDRQDLVGELVFGMAPHTSAAVVGRVVGFTSAAVGYAHPYFHAAKRRNCFHPETKVWYNDEQSEWHHERVEKLVEDRLDPVAAREDDFGALVQELDGDVFVPSVTESGDPVVKPVDAVSKHPSPDHLVRIETRSGRELTVTPGHSMRRWNDGLERVEASELTAGDSLSAPATSDGVPNGDLLVEDSESANVNRSLGDGGEPLLDEVADIEYVRSDTKYTYSLTVADTNTLVANDLYVGQCDGDEDCVMLLMDGLLNFSKQYLPDKRGGSVAADSSLLAVDPDGQIRFLTFEEFWDELDESVRYDGKFEKKLLDGEWETYTFDDDHESGLQPIERAIRYEADRDETLLRVETQFGRSLDITENHSLFRYDNGIHEVAGDELAEGDLVLAPRTLAVDTERTEIDVTACVEKPYAFIDDRVEDLLRTVWGTTNRERSAHQPFDQGLSYWLSKDKIAFDQLKLILDQSNFQVPSDIEIGFEGSSDGILRNINVDEEFAWLLGFFVTEGTTSGICPAIRSSDEEFIERAAEHAESTLGVEPDVRWSSCAYELRFPAVFRDVLYVLGFDNRDSYSSSEKVIPECILRAPDEIVLAFLRGFIAGDGNDTSNDNIATRRFRTMSEGVKDGIIFLLHRFGFVADVSRRERSDSRQPIYTVTVSDGASDKSLSRILKGKEQDLPKNLVVRIPEVLMDIREMDVNGVKRIIPKHLKRRENVSLEKLREILIALDDCDLPERARNQLADIRPLVEGDLSYLRVESIERIDYGGYLYDLQVGGEPIFTANWLYAHNSMDAPLVMSSRIDPAEIDDEAHNMDIVDRYPREFYEATRELADPEAVEIHIAEETLGTDDQYRGFRHTHDTSDIAAGPDLSAYKTLGSMMEKMDAQLELARKLRAVDETDVAERVIEYHFLPDLIGNLRAFSRQETRCLDCGEKYRRMPLTGDCRECGGTVNLTVHEGSVNKYMDTAIHVAEEFDCREYTKQRLEILEQSLESVFEDDTNKQSGIADFM